MGVLGLDSKGHVQIWNAAAERILGWTRQERIGNPLPVELKLLEDQHIGESEHSLRTKAEVLVDVRAHAVPWHTPSGEHGKLILLLDMSALRTMEGKLLEAMTQEQDARAEVRAERRFRELLEAAPDAIIQVDSEGRIQLLNRVTEKLFGYQREELEGKSMEVLIPEELRMAHQQHRLQYRNHPSTRPMGSGLRLEGRRKDGTRFPVEISLSPVQSEDGFRVTAVVRDVTERKRAEDHLRSVQEKYTRDLAASNRELELRNQQIERANRLKSEFLASMSHELRTPLHTIIGFSELLGEELEGPLNEKQKRFINHIHKDSLHLLELINDILDLSKIEAGRLELRPEVFDVRAVLDESLASIRPLSAAKSQTLESNMEAPLALRADRLRIKQVLVNLLSNAVKFTSDGGRISVTVRTLGPEAVITVSDTGIGIPVEEHETVFDKFYQVSATTKGVREGTGLGLAITKRLVEEHGGRIWVKSEPGRGSAFTLAVPIDGPHGGVQ